MTSRLDLEHPSPEPKPLARVYGEAFNDLPHDLYIPPEALEVFLESFEGPLDLLLYLIRKQNINVLDIPMADLTRQYLGYVEMMRRTQLELAAEYLLMAAVLIEIKSRLLLPKPPAPPGDEAEDPRAELVRRLLEYERMKQAARVIDEHAARRARLRDGARLVRPRRGAAPARCLARRPEGRVGGAHPARARQPAPPGHARAALGAQRNEPHAEVARRRRATPSSRRCSPSTPTSPHLVVTFLAMLELAREQLVSIAQTEPYAPIHVHLKGDAGLCAGRR